MEGIESVSRLLFRFSIDFHHHSFRSGNCSLCEKNDSAVLITEAWNDSPPDVRQSLSAYVGCCGLKSFNDSLPNSYVCPPPFNVRSTTSACLPMMVDIFNHSFTSAGACGIAFSVIMLAGLVFVCYLMTGIRRKKEENEIAKLRTGGDMGNIDGGGEGGEEEEEENQQHQGTETQRGQQQEYTDEQQGGQQEIGQEDVQYEEERV